MRRFIITGHKAVADGSFKLDDLGGGGGRVDILCRCVNSSFVLSHKIRTDAEIYLIMEAGDDCPKTVRIDGSTVRYLNPDERSTASLIRNACLKKVPAGKELVSSPGVSVSRRGFADVVKDLEGKGTFVYLKEDGTDIRDFEFPENPIYVLGDNQDLTVLVKADVKSVAVRSAQQNGLPFIALEHFVGDTSDTADRQIDIILSDPADRDRRLAELGDGNLEELSGLHVTVKLHAECILFFCMFNDLFDERGRRNIRITHCRPPFSLRH